MKGSVCLGVLLVMVLVMAAPAIGQEEVMTLAPTEQGAHQRPAVVFAHAVHGEMIECSRCHHDYDAYGANLGNDGTPCADCHTDGDGANAIGLTRAFHSQCRGCHLNVRKSEPVSPPIACAGCHRRTE